jgi:hypothetical protein
MFGMCMRLFCVCVVLCLVSGLATSRSLAQRVLPSVKNYNGTEYEDRALNGLEEPLERNCDSLRCVIKFYKYFSRSSCLLSVPHILRFYIYLQVVVVENCKYGSFLFSHCAFLPVSFSKR